MKTKVNNKQFIKLILKDDSSIPLAVNKLHKTHLSFLDMKPIINKKNEVLMLKINHANINTLLDLTHVVPYTLLCFNEKLEFCGTSFSLNKIGASYVMQTEYKTILFFKHPNNLKLSNIKKLSYE